MHAIPTTYASVNFRSRLEARWAAFLDGMGVPWDYEPLELDGYIPDFVLRPPGDDPRRVIVEVKPAWTLADYFRPVAKIEQAWKQSSPKEVFAFLILGESPLAD